MCTLISTIKIQDKTTCCFKITFLSLTSHFNYPSQQLCGQSTGAGQRAPGTGGPRKKQARAFGACPFGALIQASERGIRPGERFSD